MFKFIPDHVSSSHTKDKAGDMMSWSNETSPRNMSSTPLFPRLQPAHVTENITTRNVYMGVGPCGLRPKDKVVAICGCAPYVVLRAYGDKYHVIGDAYANSSSDSPGLEGLDNHDNKPVEITLC